MAYPQGINFRATAVYVTDVSPADNEVGDAGDVNNPDYPHTTVQGNNVGWEGTVVGGFGTRDRSTSPDTRLAGMHFSSNAATRDYRFDLPATGAYNIGLAAGDYTYAQGPITIEMFDTTSSLGTLVSAQSTSGGQRFFDATGVERTAAAWPGSHVLAAKTFSTTICRFRMGGTTSVIAHAYVESGGAAYDAATFQAMLAQTQGGAAMIGRACRGVYG